MTIEAAPKRVRFAGRRLLGFAAIALLAAFFCAPAAFAQDDPFGWFTHLFQPAPAPSHVMKQKRPSDRAQRRPARPAAARGAAEIS